MDSKQITYRIRPIVILKHPLTKVECKTGLYYTKESTHPPFNIKVTEIETLTQDKTNSYELLMDKIKTPLHWFIMILKIENDINTKISGLQKRDRSVVGLIS